MEFFARHRVGELTSRITSDLGMFQAALTGVAPQFLGQLVSVSGGLVLIAMTSLRLTAVMLVSVPPAVGLAVLFRRKIHRMSRETQDKVASMNVLVDETFQGIGSVKAFTNEELEAGRYQSRLEESVQSTLKVAGFQGGFGSLIRICGFGSILLVLWSGARLISTGELTAGKLTQFMLYTMFIGGGIGQFARMYADVQRFLGSTQRVREMLAQKEEEESGTTGSLDKRIEGRIEFEDVHFTYPSRPEMPVLKGITIRASPGERIALAGPSGAGKSTIVSLLLRFYPPGSGCVKIDGIEAGKYSLKSLRGQTAVVPQEVLLFGGTIAENIAYGRPGATRKEIEEAAKRANADKFILSFPQGYETIVGERGTALSGGQRQRVAIARAILRNPAILILDEATSSLDAESESQVQEALDRLMQGRTSIIIAHRFSTIRNADRIYVIQAGQVVEEGNHDELSARKDGLYRQLAALQFDNQGVKQEESSQGGDPQMSAAET